MVTATVDNTPVTVLLRNNETYTPATGSIQKVTVTCPNDEGVRADDAGGAAKDLIDFSSGGGGGAFMADMVIDDSITLIELGGSTDTCIYISGFEVN